jgi:hypothetical protein
MTENWIGLELSLLTKLTLMGVINPIRAKEFNTTHNTLELFGQAKNKPLIRFPNIRAEQIVCTILLQPYCGISQGWLTVKPLTTKHGRGHCTMR